MSGRRTTMPWPHTGQVGPAQHALHSRWVHPDATTADVTPHAWHDTPSSAVCVWGGGGGVCVCARVRACV